MKRFVSNGILLIKRLLFLMALYTFCRAYFLICNISSFQPINTHELFWSFFAGLRFDFSAILFLNILFYIPHFFPFKFVENKTYQSVLKQIMLFVNMFGILLNIIDTGYFSFQNGRSGSDFLSNMLFSADTVNLLPVYVRDYWYHTLVFVALYVVGEKWFPKYKSYDIECQKFAIPICILSAVIFTVGSFFIYRGFGVKTFSVVDAMRFTEAKYAPLTLNTPFTVVRTMGKTGITLRTYFDDDKAASYYSAQHHYSFTDEEFSQKNVVIFILESFSQRSIGALNTREKGYTPFLDSIIGKSYAFTNAFANGTKSIQAVPAILSSIPQMTDVTIIGSKYAANKVDALPLLLREEGYQTAFFHGAFNGTMGFDKYCEAVGFDRYFGMNEFLEENSMDGNYDSDWGIFDDKFLLYSKEQIDDFKQPFFATIFTISSHHPYVLPEEYKNSFDEKKPELNALRYADFSLQKFFEAARSSNWFNNTIFVFVADHTSPFSFEPDVTSAYISPIDRHRVPIVFYTPNDTTFVKRSQRIVQQIDILPSLLYKLHYNKPFIAFGENVFDEHGKPCALYYNAGTFTYIDSSSVIEYTENTVPLCYKVYADSISKTTPTEAQMNHLKAFLQEYSHRMIFNKTSVSEQ